MTNRLLSRVAGAIRDCRPPTPAEHTHTLLSLSGQRHLYAFVCFRSRGCRFDYYGQCAMCEYWRSEPPTPQAMLGCVEEALSRLETVPETLQIQPSGSMFDPWEVPVPVREAIFARVARTGCRRYVCESRPEFVTTQALAGMRAAMPDQELVVEIGLESAREFILDFCLNKQPPSKQFLTRHGVCPGSFLDLFGQAVSAASHPKVAVFANILLGAPFLSPEEAIQDTVHSVNWALSAGARKCILFPSHVKSYTVLQALWELGHYAPPSLWSLVEVLWRLGPELARDCFISWYRPQYTSVHRRLGKRSRAWPVTCPACEGKVLARLDAYRGGEDFAHVDALYRLSCPCKTRWRQSLGRPPELPLTDRVLVGYADLVRHMLPPQLAQALLRQAEADIHLAVPPDFAITPGGSR